MVWHVTGGTWERKADKLKSTVWPPPSWQRQVHTHSTQAQRGTEKLSGKGKRSNKPNRGEVRCTDWLTRADSSTEQHSTAQASVKSKWWKCWREKKNAGRRNFCQNYSPLVVVTMMKMMSCSAVTVVVVVDTVETTTTTTTNKQIWSGSGGGGGSSFCERR